MVELQGYPEKRFTVAVSTSGLYPRADADKAARFMGSGSAVYELVPASDADAVRALIRDRGLMIGWFANAMETAKNRRSTAENERLKTRLVQCVEAIRLTREYVGEDLLPMLAGWSWYDAVVAVNAAIGPVWVPEEDAENRRRLLESYDPLDGAVTNG